MSTNTVKVLLVEDDALDAKLVEHRLAEDAELEFILETVTTLQSACTRIIQGGIDVIIADLSLPDSDRQSTLKTLQAQAPNIPIVALTGHDDTNFELDMVRKGAQDYLLKDQVTRHLLIRVVLHAIERQRLKKENETLAAQMEKLALLDPLTELFNRRGLQRVLSREIAWARRAGLSLLAMLLDLDNFKQINETFGYTTGDEVLVQVTQRLAHALRATDYIARVGGDEFIILLPQTSLADGLAVAERARSAVSNQPIAVGSNQLQVTTSLGIDTVPDGTSTVHELLDRLNPLLAWGKQEGKNRLNAGFSIVDRSV